MSFDHHAEAELMRETAEIARDVILPRYRALRDCDVDTKGQPDDLVTVADREAEERLTAAVGRIVPDAAVIGEEAVAADAKVLDRIEASDLSVIIDPIDGTWNFANGVNSFGVILAVVEKGRTAWGGLYDPLRDDWIVARRGNGAFFIAADGSRAGVSVGTAPKTLRETSGSIPLYMYDAGKQADLAALFPKFRRIHSLRCSLFEYRLLSQGGSDFNLTAMLHPWDHAAGALIATEAGATSRLLDGRDYAPTLREGRLLTARSEALWTRLAETFAFLE